MTTDDPHRWLRDLPSTNATIVVGLGLAVLYVVVSLAADLAGHQLGDGTHLAVALFIGTMIGLNVAQFTSKRFSDTAYAAAKASGPSTVTVEAPSSVTVTPEEKTEVRG